MTFIFSDRKIFINWDTSKRKFCCWKIARPYLFLDRKFILLHLLGVEQGSLCPVLYQNKYNFFKFSSSFSSLQLNSKFRHCCILHHFVLAVTFDGGFTHCKVNPMLGWLSKDLFLKRFSTALSFQALSDDSQETLHFAFSAAKYKCKYTSPHLLLKHQFFSSTYVCIFIILY